MNFFDLLATQPNVSTAFRAQFNPLADFNGLEADYNRLRAEVPLDPVHEYELSGDEE